MAEYSLGQGAEALSDLERRAREAAPALDEMRRKDEQRQAVEEKGVTVEERATAGRGDMDAATRRLTSALTANAEALTAEISAIDASTAALLRNAEARVAVAAAAGRTVTRGAVAAEASSVANVAPQQASAAVQIAEQRAAAERAAISAEISAAAGTIQRPGTPRAGDPTATLTAATRVQQAQQREAINRVIEQNRQQLSGGGLSGASTAAATAERDATRQAEAHAAVVAKLSQQERDAARAVNEAGAAYANSANTLSRNGALTTEFIQAFARGEVTLREFESQMISTMGKFGGWAIAGGLVYGVFDAFKHLTQGATESQAAVQQLGRFIPGLGGPAGGGSGQTGAAISTVRNISSQFNVPISEVTDSMQVMARTFHNITDAGEATRAVLAAVRLDQVPVGEATQYITGISQSLGFTSGSQAVGVINALNALQANTGARVSQTLPGVARAAPAAVAGGLDTPALEAMVALGVRAGLTGNQVGTAITRSITNFAFTRGTQTFENYGISPRPGDYGSLIREVANVIDTRTRAGTLRGQDLTNLARALGGPQLSRVFLPLLAQEEINPGSLGRPGAFQAALQTAQHPRPYQEDLNAVLAQVSERFKSIGIALQNFGSRIAQAGLLTPLTTGLSAMTTFIHAIEMVTNPLVHLVGLFNQLPGPVRDVLAAFLVARGARALYNTSFGSIAQDFIGRLPGLGALNTEPRQAIRSTVARLRNSVLPLAERDQANADTAYLRTSLDQQAASRRLRGYIEGGGRDEEELRALEADVTTAENRMARAKQRAADASAFTAQVEDDIKNLTSRELDTQGKINYMKDRLLVAVEAEAVAQEEVTAAVRNVAPRGGGGAAAGGAATAAGGAAAKAATIALVSDAAVVGAATATMARSGQVARDIGQLSSDATASIPGQLAFGVEGAASRVPPPPPVYEQGALSGFEESLTGVANTMRVQRSAMQNIADSAGFLGTRVRAGASAIGDAAATSVRGVRGAWGAFTEGGAAGITGRLTSPGALLAATFATQMIGGTVHGGIGQWISGTGGNIASGALIGSMVGRGPYGALIGAGVGSVAGGFQQNTATGVASLVGGGVGALIGTAIAPGLGTAIGFGIGSTVGNVAASVLGLGQQPKQDQQDPAQLARLQAANAVMRAQSGGQALDPQSYGDLVTAFQGSGSSQQSAQARLSAIMQRLTAEQQLFGPDTVQGRAANTAMSQMISGAAQGAALDPNQALQILQAADQSRNQQLQRSLQYRVSTAAPGQALAQGAYVGSQYTQNYQQTWVPAIADTRQRVQSWQAIVTQLQAQADAGDLSKAGQAQLKAAQSQLSQAQAALGAVTSAADTARQSAELNRQAAVQSAYQADMQTNQAQGQLAAAQAGGGSLRQLQANLRTQQNALALTRRAQAAGLDPTTAHRDILAAQAQITQTHTQMTQYGLTQVQAQGQLASARVPLGDPIGAARVNLDNLEQQYRYMVDHKNAFDPTQIMQGLAAITTARKQLAEAAVQYETQMSGIATQIAQAQAFGDTVAQAAAGVAGAMRNVGIAARGTPQEQAQAQLGLISAQNQAQQAAFERIGQSAQTQSAQQWGNPVAQAQTMLQAAQRQLSTARGFDEQNQALQAIAQAQQQLNQALVSHTEALGQLAASTTNDPLQQLRDQISATTHALGQAQGADTRIQIQTQLNNLKLQYQNTLVSQREGTINFQFQMMQITSQQAVHQLQDLLKLHNLNVQQRQAILQQIRQYQLGLVSPLGASGQFDLAPGNVRLPTFYDVQHALRGGRPAAAGTMTAINNAPQINVYVARSEDVPKVADVLDRATGSHLRGKLRAAGVR